VPQTTKQGKYDPNRQFSFPIAARQGHLDLLQSTGSSHFYADDELNGTHRITISSIQPGIHGRELMVHQKMHRSEAIPSSADCGASQNIGIQRLEKSSASSKRFLQDRGIEDLLATAVRTLVQSRPSDPSGFLADYFMNANVPRWEPPPFSIGSPYGIRHVEKLRMASQANFIDALHSGELRDSLSRLRLKNAPTKEEGSQVVAPKKESWSAEYYSKHCWLCPDSYWQALHSTFPRKEGSKEEAPKDELTKNEMPRVKTMKNELWSAEYYSKHCWACPDSYWQTLHSTFPRKEGSKKEAAKDELIKKETKMSGNSAQSKPIVAPPKGPDLEIIHWPTSVVDGVLWHFEKGKVGVVDPQGVDN